MGGHAKIGVVGASGFVGRNLTHLLRSRGEDMVAITRSGRQACADAAMCRQVDAYTDVRAVADALAGCAAAIVLVGRAHVLKDGDSAVDLFYAANVDAPLAISEAASRAGVRRLVLVSTIAVHGQRSGLQPLRETDIPAPDTDYGWTKWQAEERLTQQCADLGLELVIVRPPLVYGANAPGNFGQLLRAICVGIPLPLGAVHNRRDFIGVENLCDALLFVSRHPDADGVYLVSDTQETSTAHVVRTLYRARGSAWRVIKVPKKLLQAGLKLAGKSGLVTRLIDDLRVDSSRLQRLGWVAPVVLDEGLRRSLMDTVR